MVSMAIPVDWSEGEAACQIQMPIWECLRGLGGNLWGDRWEGVRGGIRGQGGLYKQAKRFQGGQVRVIRVREIWVDRIGPRKTCYRDLQGSYRYRKQGGGYGRCEKGFKELKGIRAWGMLGLRILGEWRY